MASVAFDTLKAAQRLGDAGFSNDQAEALVKTLSESITENLATKDDIKDVRSEIAALDTKIDRVEERLEAKIDSLTKDLTIRLGSLMVVGIAIIAAIVEF